jgi:hypothetical protein
MSFTQSLPYTHRSFEFENQTDDIACSVKLRLPVD